MEKKYIVQQQYPDGRVSVSVNTAQQIVNFIGFSDCSGCDYEVFDGSEFGKLVKLNYQPDDCPCHHTFVRSDSGEVEFDGYSAAH